MRMSKKIHSLSVRPRTRFGAMLFFGALIAPGLAHASTVMTPSQMRLEAEKARNQVFDFEVTCGVNGVSSLILDQPGYADTCPSYPPALAKCLVFGNQDQARYLCMCADSHDPVSGDVPADEIPKLVGSVPGSKALDAFEELCTGRFTAACGPFPESVEARCQNEAGKCGLLARGNRRDGGFNNAHSLCACEEGFVWESAQEFKDEFLLDQASANALCTAQLESCNRSVKDPVLHDFQSLPAGAYTNRMFGCRSETKERLDECVVHSRDGEAEDSFRCYCSGTELSGEVYVDGGGVAQGMAKACGDLLTRCEHFEPDPPDPEDDEEDEPKDDEELSWEEIFDALGCRAAPSSGFGSLLGVWGAFLLGVRFRRRRF